jgi:UTP:GlnB (protein PII) uridylyltransferase
VSLSQVPAATSPVPDTLLLDDYLLERSTRCEGSLYLEVSGPDRIGLLSSLLNTFSLYALFPAEMLVETQKKRVFDRFWLKGLGGTAPSAEATAAIRERMQECTYGAGVRS